jgi:hypothetical protein
MSEKRGNIVKLEYDFDTARNLEVYMPNLSNWFRVTSREFRSFNGERRIQGKKYNGPVYLFGTNQTANTGKYELGKIVEHKFTSIRRPGE